MSIVMLPQCDDGVAQSLSHASQGWHVLLPRHDCNGTICGVVAQAVIFWLVCIEIDAVGNPGACIQPITLGGVEPEDSVIRDRSGLMQIPSGLLFRSEEDVVDYFQQRERERQGLDKVQCSKTRVTDPSAARP